MVESSPESRRLATAVVNFLAVGAGVLIALWADQWWADRQDAQAERVYLAALQQDIIATVLVLDDSTEELTEWLDAAAKLSKTSPEGPYPSNEELIDLIGRALFNLEVYELNLSAYRDLKNTGGLRLITRDNIRRSLADLDQRLEELRTAEADLIATQHGLFDPFLVRHTDLAAVAKAGYLDSDTRRAEVSGGPVAPRLIGPPSGIDHTALFYNQEFRNLVALRIVLISEVIVSAENIKSLLLVLQQQIEDTGFIA